MYSCKNMKKPIGVIRPKFCLYKTMPTLLFFAYFQFNMSGDSISINKFAAIVLKKNGKTL